MMSMTNTDLIAQIQGVGCEYRIVSKDIEHGFDVWMRPYGNEGAVAKQELDGVSFMAAMTFIGAAVQADLDIEAGVATGD